MTIALRNPSNDPEPNRLYGAAPVKGISVIWHNGNDYGWGQGRQVYAAAAGRVSARRWSSSTPRNNRSGGYGNYIVIDHGNGYSTLYAHLPNSNPMVNIGQQVTAGERIGTMGNSGNAYGVHLHFMLFLNGRIIDPNPYFGSATAGTETTMMIITEDPEPPTESEETMIVFANTDTNVWAAADAGRFQGIPSGQGDAYIKISGRDLVPLNNAEFTTARDWHLRGKATDTKVYADTSSNVWYIIGPGTFYAIPGGKGSIYESVFGPRIAVSSGDITDLRDALAPIGIELTSTTAGIIAALNNIRVPTAAENAQAVVAGLKAAL